jgi:hypothetical protein
MAERTREFLKGKFETGDIPTEQDFSDTIDSNYNITDDDADVLTDGATKVLMTATERTKLENYTEPLKVWVGLGNFSSPPSLSVLGSTFSNALTVTRQDVGEYRIESATSEFAPGSTVVYIQTNVTARVSSNCTTDQRINVNVAGVAGTGLDTMIDASIRIEVYES